MRFTIRDILIFTLIGGLCLGWWIDHRRSQREIAQIQKQLAQTSTKLAVVSHHIRRLGFSVEIDDHLIAVYGSATEIFKDNTTDRRAFQIGLETDDAWETNPWGH